MRGGLLTLGLFLLIIILLCFGSLSWCCSAILWFPGVMIGVRGGLRSRGGVGDGVGWWSECDGAVMPSWADGNLRDIQSLGRRRQAVVGDGIPVSRLRACTTEPYGPPGSQKVARRRKGAAGRGVRSERELHRDAKGIQGVMEGWNWLWITTFAA